eukprot:5898781-Prymnesium_polylepis.2
MACLLRRRTSSACWGHVALPPPLSIELAAAAFVGRRGASDDAALQLAGGRSYTRRARGTVPGLREDQRSRRLYRA